MDPVIVIALNRSARRLGLALLLVFAYGISLRAEGLWVATKMLNGYHRTLLPDGTFKPETYAFGDAGRVDGSLANDPADKAKFLDVAHILARPLANQGYIPSRVGRETELLILVAWGTTQGSGDTMNSGPYQTGVAGLQQLSALKNQSGGMDPLSRDAQDADAAISSIQSANRLRDEQDYKNSKILGFERSFTSALEMQHMTQSKDLLDELGANRYFVVLKALDFQAATKEKKLKVFWEARFSIPQQGVDFMEQLPAMAQTSSQYFGKNGGQLIRPVPAGKVKVGEPKVIEDQKK